MHPFLTKILTHKTPIMVDKRVAKIVGKIISAGEEDPSEVRSAITEDGIICMLVALITKNILIAY